MLAHHQLELLAPARDADIGIQRARELAQPAAVPMRFYRSRPGPVRA